MGNQFSKKSVQVMISVVIIGALVFLYKSSDSPKNFFENSFNNTPTSAKATTHLTLRGGEERNKRYESKEYGFEVSLPEGAEVTKIEEEGTILVKFSSINGQVSNNSEFLNFQIHVSEFDEDIVLTAERIKRDIADMKMKDEEDVMVGGVRGVAFIDLEQNTREVWFVRAPFLYQVTSEPEDDQLVGEVMQSWKWKES